jgi:glycosyltransferase involved in cell wall biosynthesis
MNRVILQWPSFGPYHTARLLACANEAPPGVEVIGLAVAGQVDGRPWLPDKDLTGLEIVTLFPDSMYHELSAELVKTTMQQKLDALNPAAMGISGYGMADSRAALRWCRRRGVPRVLMTESKADDAPRSWWKELAKRHLVKQFGSALCGGRPHRAYLHQLGMRDEHIFDKYDVVDNSRFATAVAEVRAHPERYRDLPGLADPRPFFLVSSRFIARKNLPRLLDAYHQYRLSDPDGWRMVILGTGPDAGALESKVANQAIPDVCFAGFQQFDSLVAYYGFAGAFVHPAIQEQWGLVVNEAMACGLPVLVSKTVGAAHDLVVDGVNGYTFDPLSTGEITEALARLAADSDKRRQMADRSLEILREWTPQHFAKNFWAAVAVAASKGN